MNLINFQDAFIVDFNMGRSVPSKGFYFLLSESFWVRLKNINVFLKRT